MNDKLEKTLKELLPYIIIIGIIFLLLPLFMGKTASALTYIIQIGVFPLTAFGCGLVYKIQKKRNNLILCLLAPIFYALSALLYCVNIAREDSDNSRLAEKLLREAKKIPDSATFDCRVMFVLFRYCRPLFEAVCMLTGRRLS